MAKATKKKKLFELTHVLCVRGRFVNQCLKASDMLAARNFTFYFVFISFLFLHTLRLCRNVHRISLLQALLLPLIRFFFCLLLPVFLGVKSWNYCYHSSLVSFLPCRKIFSPSLMLSHVYDAPAFCLRRLSLCSVLFFWGRLEWWNMLLLPTPLLLFIKTLFFFSLLTLFYG